MSLFFLLKNQVIFLRQLSIKGKNYISEHNTWFGLYNNMKYFRQMIALLKYKVAGCWKIHDMILAEFCSTWLQSDEHQYYFEIRNLEGDRIWVNP